MKFLAVSVPLSLVIGAAAVFAAVFCAVVVASYRAIDRSAFPPDVRSSAKRALHAALGLIGCLWVGKHLAALTGMGDVIFTGIAAYQIYVPLRLLQVDGELPEAARLHAHGAILGPLAWLRSHVVRVERAAPTNARRALRRGSRLLAAYARGAKFDSVGFAGDARRAGLTALVTFPLFALLHHAFQLRFGALGYRFVLPSHFWSVWAQNTFLVALPEEMFYRGFLESRLERVWPTKRFFLTLPISRTVFLASALFALGHFVGEYNPARLAPFFPAFVFSMLTRRGDSIAGAVLYHGASNAFSALLFAGYTR